MWLFMHVKLIQKKMYLLKMSGPKIWLCLFTFQPTASKQLLPLRFEVALMHIPYTVEFINRKPTHRIDF